MATSTNTTTTATSSRPLTREEIATFTKRTARAVKAHPAAPVTGAKPEFFFGGEGGFDRWYEAGHQDCRPEAVAAIIDGDRIVGVQATFVAYDNVGGFAVPSEFKANISLEKNSLVWNFVNNWGRRTAVCEVAAALGDIGL